MGCILRFAAASFTSLNRRYAIKKHKYFAKCVCLYICVCVCVCVGKLVGYTQVEDIDYFKTHMLMAYVMLCCCKYGNKLYNTSIAVLESLPPLYTGPGGEQQPFKKKQLTD